MNIIEQLNNQFIDALHILKEAKKDCQPYLLTGEHGFDYQLEQIEKDFESALDSFQMRASNLRFRIAKFEAQNKPKS